MRPEKISEKKIKLKKINKKARTNDKAGHQSIVRTAAYFFIRSLFLSPTPMPGRIPTTDIIIIIIISVSWWIYKLIFLGCISVWGPDCERPWAWRSDSEPESDWQKDTWYLSKYAWLKWNVCELNWMKWIHSNARACVGSSKYSRQDRKRMPQHRHRRRTWRKNKKTEMTKVDGKNHLKATATECAVILDAFWCLLGSHWRQTLVFGNHSKSFHKTHQVKYSSQSNICGSGGVRVRLPSVEVFTQLKDWFDFSFSPASQLLTPTHRHLLVDSSRWTYLFNIKHVILLCRSM